MFQYILNLIYEMGSNFEVLQLIWAILSLPIGNDSEIEYSKSNGPQIEAQKPIQIEYYAKIKKTQAFGHVSSLFTANPQIQRAGKCRKNEFKRTTSNVFESFSSPFTANPQIDDIRYSKIS